MQPRGYVLFIALASHRAQSFVLHLCSANMFTTRHAITCTAAATRASVTSWAIEPYLTFYPLESPANYSELLENAPIQAISVIKYQAPFCRACREPSELCQTIAATYPSATFYSVDLPMNRRKAAGKRMAAFFKERNVREMPYIEIYRGNQLLEATVERTLAAQSCVLAPEAMACSELPSDANRPLLRLLDLSSQK